MCGPNKSRPLLTDNKSSDMDREILVDGKVLKYIFLEVRG
jgi:hypothetical protein